MAFKRGVRKFSWLVFGIGSPERVRAFASRIVRQEGQAGQGRGGEPHGPPLPVISLVISWSMGIGFVLSIVVVGVFVLMYPGTPTPKIFVDLITVTLGYFGGVVSTIFRVQP